MGAFGTIANKADKILVADFADGLDFNTELPLSLTSTRKRIINQHTITESNTT